MIGENQEQYETLPAFVGDDGDIWSCWEPTFWERLKMLFGSKIWHYQKTCSSPMQPIFLTNENVFNKKVIDRLQKQWQRSKFMKKHNTPFLICMALAATAVFAMSGCSAQVKEFVQRGATKTAEVQCKLSTDARLAARKLYFQANEGQKIKVSFCKGEVGFEQAKATYIDEPSALLDAVKSAVGGDWGGVESVLFERAVKSGVVGQTADGCMKTENGWKLCQPQAPPDKSDE